MCVYIEKGTKEHLRESNSDVATIQKNAVSCPFLRELSCIWYLLFFPVLGGAGVLTCKMVWEGY